MSAPLTSLESEMLELLKRLVDPIFRDGATEKARELIANMEAAAFATAQAFAGRAVFANGVLVQNPPKKAAWNSGPNYLPATAAHKAAAVEDRAAQTEPAEHVARIASFGRGGATFHFSYTEYISSHGAMPRGRGSWAFVFREGIVGYRELTNYTNDAVWFTPGGLTFSEAKKAAKAEARKRLPGASDITVGVGS